MILEKLSEALQLSASVTRLFVFEIKQRASHSNAMDAAAAIMDWLSPPNTDSSPPADDRSSTTGDSVDGGGWLLLNALTLLALGPYELVMSLVQNALPSTLLKCLYIFPELPAAIASASERLPSPSPLPSASTASATGASARVETEANRRLLVHKLFSQVCVSRVSSVFLTHCTIALSFAFVFAFAFTVTTICQKSIAQCPRLVSSPRVASRLLFAAHTTK